jgi:hypothetical protein
MPLSNLIRDTTLKRKGRLKVDATIRGLQSTTPASPAEEPANRVRLVK